MESKENIVPRSYKPYVKTRSALSETNLNKSPRKISESTGLAKFSLRPTTINPPSPRKRGLPIQVPLSPERSPTQKRENDILFKMAKKERQVMDLKTKLALAQRELDSLTAECRKMNISDSPERSNPIAEITRKLEGEFKSNTLKARHSILNFTNSFIQENEFAQAVNSGVKQHTLKAQRSLANFSLDQERNWVTKSRLFLENLTLSSDERQRVYLNENAKHFQLDEINEGDYTCDTSALEGESSDEDYGTEKAEPYCV